MVSQKLLIFNICLILFVLLGSLPLGEVVKLFDKEVLKQLKSECGGLQTLLKNHNNIFHGKFYLQY